MNDIDELENQKNNVKLNNTNIVDGIRSAEWDVTTSNSIIIQYYQLREASKFENNLTSPIDRLISL